MRSKYLVLVVCHFLMIQPCSLFSKEKVKNNADVVIQFSPNWTEEGTVFKHSWEGYASIDQAFWLQHFSVQSQIALAHKDLKANNLRTVSLLDDNMRVWGLDPKTWKDKDRTSRMNFRMIDEVFQLLLDNGVNPVVSTNFMPKKLALIDKDVFKTGSSAPPRDYKEWEMLISSLTKHLVDHFGLEVVKKWDFEVWNEPNLDYFWKDANKEEFFKLWEITYKTIKAVNPEIRIGGPSTARAEWIPEFIDFARKHSCEPDYIIVHIYNNDSEFAALSPFDGPQTDKINKSPHYVAAVVRGARKQMNDLGFKGELHFNEWGSSWFPTDETRETANEAAFIAMTMANCSQFVDRMTYWCLSDHFDQAGYAAEAFYGGFGMLSMDGLKKPSFKAFELLSKLGNRQLTFKSLHSNSLQNAIATKNNSGYQFLYYAFDQSFVPNVTKPTKQSVSLLLPEGVTLQNISIYQINSVENNIFYQWAKMNKPTYFKKEQLLELNKFNALEKFNTNNYSIAVGKGGNILKFETESSGLVLVDILK